MIKYQVSFHLYISSSLSSTALFMKFPLRDVSIFQNEMPNSKLNGCTPIPIAAGAQFSWVVKCAFDWQPQSHRTIKEEV